MNEKVKCTKVYHYLRSQEADIIFIQEMHFTKSKHRIVRNEWGDQVYFSDGESNARGVATFIKPGLDCSVEEVFRDGNGRQLNTTLKINNQSWQMINIYAPNVDQPSFFAKIFENLNNQSPDHIVLGGDLNVILDTGKDRKSFNKNTKITKSGTLINTFLEEAEWIDCWRQRNHDKFRYT